MYNNKNPFGYGSRMNINGIRPFEEELIRGIFDIVNPFRGWKPKETPYWKAILQN